MAVNVTPLYSVTTPPYSTNRHAGSLWSIMGRQFRYCAFEGAADTALGCGQFVTATVDALGNYRFKQLSAATDKIFGVSFLNTQRVLTWNSTLEVFEYQADDPVSLIEEGDVFMYAEVAVAAGDPVFTRHAIDAGLNRIGALGKAAGTGLVAVPGAKFLKALAAPGLVPVSLPGII